MPKSSSRITKIHVNNYSQNTVIAKGLPKSYLGDLYYTFLNRSWIFLFSFVVFAFLCVNFIFAVLFYLGRDSIGNATENSLTDAFFFSVQTFATIGYGHFYPKTLFANILVTCESFLGLVGIAVVTGLTFAKFSKPRARVIFSDCAVVSPHDGVPTLMFRIANQRANQIAEASLNMCYIKRQKTLEGQPFNKMIDLDMVRTKSPMFTLTWTALHILDEKSPIFHAIHNSQNYAGDFIVCSLTGQDATTGQTIHARHYYQLKDVKIGHNFKNIFSVNSEGISTIDYNQFHATEENL